MLLTGAASPSQAPWRHHLHPSACSPCHTGTLYMAGLLFGGLDKLCRSQR